MILKLCSSTPQTSLLIKYCIKGITTLTYLKYKMLVEISLIVTALKNYHCGYCDPVRMYRKGPRSASRGTVRQTDSQTQLMGGGTGNEKYHEDIEAISREQN